MQQLPAFNGDQLLLSLFLASQVCEVNLEILFHFQIYGLQAACRSSFEETDAERKPQREKGREPLNSQDGFESEAKKGSKGDRARARMYVCVWVSEKETEKAGFNAAGLSTQSAPVL